MKIAIIDYGMGNIQSIVNCFKNLNSTVYVVNDPSKLKDYSSYILPGVGAYPSAMKNLKSSNMSDSIKKQVLIKKKTSTWNLFGYATIYGKGLRK